MVFGEETQLDHLDIPPVHRKLWRNATINRIQLSGMKYREFEELLEYNFGELPSLPDTIVTSEERIWKLASTDEHANPLHASITANSINADPQRVLDTDNVYYLIWADIKEFFSSDDGEYRNLTRLLGYVAAAGGAISRSSLKELLNPDDFDALLEEAPWFVHESDRWFEIRPKIIQTSILEYHCMDRFESESDYDIISDFEAVESSKILTAHLYVSSIGKETHMPLLTSCGNTLADLYSITTEPDRCLDVFRNVLSQLSESDYLSYTITLYNAAQWRVPVTADDIVCEALNHGIEDLAGALIFNERTLPTLPDQTRLLTQLVSGLLATHYRSDDLDEVKSLLDIFEECDFRSGDATHAPGPSCAYATLEISDRDLDQFNNVFSDLLKVLLRTESYDRVGRGILVEYFATTLGLIMICHHRTGDDIYISENVISEEIKAELYAESKPIWMYDMFDYVCEMALRVSIEYGLGRRALATIFGQALDAFNQFADQPISRRIDDIEGAAISLAKCATILTDEYRDTLDEEKINEACRIGNIAFLIDVYVSFIIFSSTEETDITPWFENIEERALNTLNRLFDEVGQLDEDYPTRRRVTGFYYVLFESLISISPPAEVDDLAKLTIERAASELNRWEEEEFVNKILERVFIDGYETLKEGNGMMKSPCSWIRWTLASEAFFDLFTSSLENDGDNQLLKLHGESIANAVRLIDSDQSECDSEKLMEGIQIWVTRLGNDTSNDMTSTSIDSIFSHIDSTELDTWNDILEDTEINDLTD